MPLDKHNLFYGLRQNMTDEQEYMANSIIDKHVVFSNSEAGTGKTTIALASLYYLYENKKIDKIYYIFSPVQEDKMGFRPGTQPEKEAEYADPIMGAIRKLKLNPEKAMDEKHGFIEVKSHTFLRGQDHERIGVIIDEAQNYTKEELKKTLTRLHDNCHVVVTGHSGQIDLKKPGTSGFVPYLNHFGKLEERVAVCPLTKNFRGWISRHADAIDNEEQSA
ncbi:PhoH family protein [Cytobacillus oceanisediminis]|uniref:PhoH family protein n=1 Tax=Cytobacillus oceanisediminis TaxID=665099 RepID=UPI001FB1BC39|nr:PhoH family protein [Cytobacillus oceanisediminis]UOE58101.1 PhoH family protein [Cytobacillus oceanisediminis]